VSRDDEDLAAEATTAADLQRDEDMWRQAQSRQPRQRAADKPAKVGRAPVPIERRQALCSAGSLRLVAIVLLLGLSRIGSVSSEDGCQQVRLCQSSPRSWPINDITRHINLESGSLEAEDQLANLQAVREGTRVFSA
jgi:hypothetical protein